MNNDKSKIGELKKYLNSRKFPGSVRDTRTSIPGERIEDIRSDWGGGGADLSQGQIQYQNMRKKRNFTKLFLISSIIFFIIALVVAMFVIFGGSNIISSQNVDISLSGPVAINGGDVLELEVIVSNNNSISLELADLIVEYPEGTRSPENLSRALPRERFSLGDIRSGDKVNQPIRAILFGQEGEVQNIKLTIEYRVAGSNAIFFKEKEYEIEISNSPISLQIESLAEVNSGKEISFEVSLRSNSENIIEDLMFIAEYPFGFSFKEASPRASFDQRIWRVGEISPGEERKIKITGTLEGQDGEERFFRFFSGIESEENEKELQTAFVSSGHSVFIKKPFLSLDLVIDGDTSLNHNSDLNTPVNVDIFWKNNLSTSVANVEIKAKLSGDFSQPSVFVERGFYNSVDNTISWSQEQNPVFGSLSPGQEGSVRFRFSSLSPENNLLLNPETSIEVSVRGRRLSENGVSEEVTSFGGRTIRFNTSLSFESKSFHFSGPISNSGPIPPVAETETTYSVVWTIKNSVNDLSDTVVTAKIPSYVRWTQNFSGTGLTYNSVSREVVWRPGDIEAGVGFASPSKEVFFQLGFLPSISQIGKAPVILTPSRLQAEDNFTGVILETTARELTTRTDSDSNFKTGDDLVVN